MSVKWKKITTRMSIIPGKKLYLPILLILLITMNAYANEIVITGNDYLMYTDGTSVYSKLEKDKTIKAAVSGMNNDTTSKSVMVILARYDIHSQKLIDISLGDAVNIGVGESKTAEGYMKLPNSDDIMEQRLKLYVWESVESAKPLTAGIEYPNREVKTVTLTEVGINYINQQEYKGGFYVEPMHEAGFPYEYIEW